MAQPTSMRSAPWLWVIGTLVVSAMFVVVLWLDARGYRGEEVTPENSCDAIAPPRGATPDVPWGGGRDPAAVALPSHLQRADDVRRRITDRVTEPRPMR